MNPTSLLISAFILIGTLSLNACKDQETHQEEAPSLTIIEPSSAPTANHEALPNEEPKASNPTQLITDLGFTDTHTGAPETTTTSKPYCLKANDSNEHDAELTLHDECLRISNRLASVSMESCLAAELKETGCHSVLGFPIMVRDFGPIKNKVPQARILVIGGTHADELTSVSTTFKWLEKLNTHHSGLFHWHVVPLMNPDGLLKKSATRTNHNGVDLNRNMPSDDWHANALHYWQTKSNKNPRRYPGEKPSSEPETQWLVDEINTFKPDAIISIHAPYGVVDFDSLLLNTAPKSLGKLHLNLLGTYPGSLGNYAGINRNIPVITVELPHAWVMPSEHELTQIWQDIVAWLKKNVNTPSS